MAKEQTPQPQPKGTVALSFTPEQINVIIEGLSALTLGKALETFGVMQAQLRTIQAGLKPGETKPEGWPTPQKPNRAQRRRAAKGTNGVANPADRR